MRLLVVEDDEAVAAALSRGLTAEGYDVDVVHDGDSGLIRAIEHDYALIVLDILLPGRNGYRVCADLRAAEVDTPILMLTAKSGEFDEAEGLDAGADDFIVKPFSFVVLAARVRALLRRPGARRHAVRSIADLEIDLDRRTCTRSGAPVHLTNREFALLEVLSRRPGAICTKDYLLSEVWGVEFRGSPNVVEVYIGYLRRKLDRRRPHPLIQTEYGVGYRLAPR